ncbi:MAG: drug efflux system protein MdtG [Methanocella sp. PtaU1.Bin125]|nr:MAG: drug efflux system protein MdtG [Methanocella sp. PtaU1.Bin125]
MGIKRSQKIVLIIAIFIFTLGFGIIIPIIPFYARNAGADAFVLGLLLATFSFLQFFCGPFWGRISDNIGRKPVVLIGLIGFTLAFLMLGLSNNLLWIFVAEIIGGALSAGIQPAAMAYIADITKPDERGGMMGALGAASGVGLISGPFISSILSPFGLSVPFFVAAGLAFVTLLAVNITITESVTTDRRLRLNDVLLPVFVAKMVVDTFRHMFGALRTPVGIYLVATLVISLAIAGFEGTFSYYIMDMFSLTDAATTVRLFGVSLSLTGPIVTGIAFALMGVIMVVCQGLMVGPMINRFGEDKVITGGLLVSAIGLALMLVTQYSPVTTIVGHDLGLLIASIGVVSVGSGLVFPGLNTIISKKTDERNQGIIMGIMTSYGNFGRIIGPPLAGYTYVVNIVMPYAISAAILAITSIGIFILGLYSQKKDQTKVAPEQVITK